MSELKDFFELLVRKFHFPEFIASGLMLFFYIIVFVWTFLWTIYKIVTSFLKRIRKRNIERILSSDLHPYFTFEEILKYTKFYIPQNYQNITPSEGEELGKIHAAAAKSKLMPEFLKKGLLTESPIKYFIILSDTGMGKTAFLINLYRKYKRLKIKSSRIKYEIYLFPLGSKNALKEIEKIADKRNSILLLDAFDEDIKAVQDYQSRMIEILDAVKDFRKVIFTCRTQFFPSKDEEPRDTNDITFGENVKHTIHKLYLSAFDNNDVFKYLLKKYELNIFQINKAYKLVKKSPNLMFRPMLLSYIDELLDKSVNYTYTFEIYSVLIDNWIDRESKKPAILERYMGNNYGEKLFKFSLTLAANLYTEREKRGGYFITVDQIKKMSIHSLVDTDELTINDKTGRSLLNRNSAGQFKFAHKSILEYFLALELFEKPTFLKKFDFTGFDAAQNFHLEMIALLLNNTRGKCYLANELKPKPLASISPNNIKKIDKIYVNKLPERTFFGFARFNYMGFAGLTSVKLLLFVDPSFLSLYYLYLIICIERRAHHKSTIDSYKLIYEKFTYEYRNIVNEIKRVRPMLEYDDVKLLVESCDIDEQDKSSMFAFLDSTKNTNPLTTEEISELRDLRTRLAKGRSENAMISEAFKTIKEIDNLSSHLPGVKIIY